MKSSATQDGESSQVVRAIIAGHGNFASGMVSAIEQITGRGQIFIAVSNSGMTGQDIERILRESVESSGARVVFTDLPGGSATVAARRVMRDVPGLVLVTGTSLPALLEFLFQDGTSSTEAAQRSAEKGRISVAAFGAT